MASLRWLAYFLCFLLFHLHFRAASSLPFSFNSSSPAMPCQHDQSLALLQFKKTFSIRSNASSWDFPYPRPYPKTESWKKGTDCCLWDGVTCDIETGNVIGLNLSSSFLYGTIHSNNTLFFLPHLQKLDLSNNDFNNSQIVPQFGQFLNLTYLSLNYSVFEGQIPLEISYLAGLVSLDLSRNYDLILKATVFNEIVQNLTQLQELDLCDLNLSSVATSSLMNLSSSVSSLALSSCELQGKFPDNIIRRPKLQLLDLSGNEDLTGSLPRHNWNNSFRSLSLSGTKIPIYLDQFGNLTQLINLDISHNNLSGQIPSSLGSLKQLLLLDLSYNNFSGEIPSSFVSLKQLETLDLRTNNLSGQIPSSLGSLEELYSLDLSYNNFHGEIPSSFGNLKYLKQLETLDLRINNLSGQIPSSLGSLEELYSLDLSYKNFHGEIPSSFGNLKQLETLDLYNNNLSGQIPSSLGSLEELYSLDLSYNNFNGEIPSSFGNLGELYSLDLSYNNFSGEIPSSFGNLKQLGTLNLYNNNLSGKIPSSLGSLKELSSLDLSCNNFNGEIPSSFENLKQLDILWLNNNNLSGPITFQGSRLSSLVYLDLSNNLLHGRIPSSIFKLVNLSVLILSSNKLIGEVSSAFCELNSLQILDLSNNSLNGSMPQCLGNFSNNLSVLHLGMNKFHGTILETFSVGSNLRYLNFNGNQLQGKIPPSICNCINLEILDLGNNNIDDTFPHFLATLSKLQIRILKSNKFHGLVKGTSTNYSFSKLRIFYLSNNLFSGPLPAEYFNNLKAMMIFDLNMKYMGAPNHPSYDYSVSLTLKGLEIELVKIHTLLTSIDLSGNKFTGEIPQSIGKLKSLKLLNLSHNQLTGNIQPSLGNLSNLESLDLSSNLLVGRIPMQLTYLTFLEVFRVSHNQLEGPIPEGKQFNTFDNTSYEGNLGLCGFPLEKCDNGERQQPTSSKEIDSKSKNGFGWKAVLAGYGCGVIFGVVMGYVVFKTRKPIWFVRMVEGEGRRRLKRLSN
ncbi:receptor-like protein Cf-9 [Hevea brasiliensis]|uniref:receptor-like protein Cf-9 n=1 Tax=Hevea brasiliensis TaxID=3981 RepID=UPI0025E8A0CF|nr:receptor-like protein Cf-9 [Hevea brasiliensis]